VFALSGLRGNNDVLRVKRGWWNKKVWETLDYGFAMPDWETLP